MEACMQLQPPLSQSTGRKQTTAKQLIPPNIVT